MDYSKPMCGICGVLSVGGRPDVGAVIRMAAVLRHRGPDAQRIETDGPLALGHTRLAIRGGTEQASQPAAVVGGGLVSYNGEIYNTDELWRRLGQSAAPPLADTTVLAAWLAAAGAIADLNGMFAFAWWRPERQELWLVRDRWGIKPLYYHRTPFRVAFASECPALLGLPEVRRKVNWEAAWSYLAATPLVHGPTLIEGILAVPPGTVAVVSARTGAVAIRPYATPLAPGDEVRALEPDAVAASLADAVRRQLASDRPVCLALSGGIDSSLIGALALADGARLPAFTAAWREQENIRSVFFAGRDADYASIAADILGLDLNLVGVSPLVTERRLNAVIRRRGLPLSHTSELAIDRLYHAIASRATVALTGEGADEVFRGYPFFGRPRFGQVPWASVSVTMLTEVIASPPSGAITPAEALRAEAQRLADLPLHHAIARGFLPYLLERLDRLSMAHSVEARVPFLDDAVAALAPAGDAYPPPGMGKQQLVSLARRLLPTVIAARPKSAFPASLGTVSARSTLVVLRRRLGGRHGPLGRLLAVSALDRLAMQDDFAARTLAWRLLNFDLWLADLCVEDTP